MIAIETRFLGSTDHRGARIVATTCNGHRLVVSYDHGAHDPHADAALALIEREGFGGVWAQGGTSDGAVFCNVNGETIGAPDPVRIKREAAA